MNENNIQDKMNTSEPAVLEFDGKPTMTLEEAVKLLQSEGE